MKRNKANIYIGIILSFNMFLGSFAFAQEYINAPGIVSVQSTFSDGRYSIEQIAKKAKEKDVKVIILTDSLLRRWEYGVPPFRNIIKRRIEQNSVLTFGAERYFKRVNKVQKDFPNIVILPGVEITPFYFWDGSFFKRNLSLQNWHEQMLAVGLNIKDCEKLPVVTNYSRLPNKTGQILYFWPILTIFLGIWLIRKIKPYLLGSLMAGISAIFLINNLFFPISTCDQYHGNQGIKPYQDLIDYVNQKGGLIFWAHPEASYHQKIKDINIYTPAYAQDLLSAYDYTGFASLYVDIISITKPADIWDQILTQYCDGKRKKPVWGTGESDYEGKTKQQIDTVLTVFLVPQLNKAEVLEALKKGKMYAKLNNTENDFSLDKFVINDNTNKKQGYMGDEVMCRSNPRLFISGSCFTHPEDVVNIQLIRKGEVIEVFEVKGPTFAIEFEDNYFKPGEKIYYRLDINNPHSRIITNPIFVNFKLP